MSIHETKRLGLHQLLPETEGKEVEFKKLDQCGHERPMLGPCKVYIIVDEKPMLIAEAESLVLGTMKEMMAVPRTDTLIVVENNKVQVVERESD